MKMVMFDLGETLEEVIDGQDILLPGALETLRTIQGLKDAQGESPILALVSNFGETSATPEQIAASQEEYFRILDNLKIRRFFEPVAQRVTLSTEAGAVKPSKKIFQTAISKIPGLRFSDVIFITEDKEHVRAARRRLRMKAIHFKGPGENTGDVDKLTDLIPLIKKFLGVVA